MQYHTYQQNHTRGSSPPFQEDPPAENAAHPAGPEEAPEESPSEKERADPAPSNDEYHWRDDGGEG